MVECLGGRNDLSTDLDLDDSAKRLSKKLYTVFPDLKIFRLHIHGQVSLVSHLI
ncbi:MAG: hypothetical protein CM1200mP1_16780 [Candidatus Neomarinimicrobiota bacterium]|nr:MAG: hypothetical protein CM1200mP1_16780 [Candidatus Neomarinimicrobiota bacterium]